MNRRLSKQQRDINILDAAERLFQHKGFPQTTMEDVAREAGISVGSIYNTFQGKEVLYSQVAERIGQAVLDRLTSAIQISDPADAIFDVIRLRLFNFSRDRLFFLPFTLPVYQGVEPRPDQLDARVTALHDQYVQFIERLFTRYAKSLGTSPAEAARSRVYLEGLISAFMGNWTDAAHSDAVAKAARQMRDMLLRAAGTPEGAARRARQTDEGQTREIYVSRFDFDRILELIEVVRVFGRKEWLTTARSLETILKTARVGFPHEVPPDVVTMNTRVSLRLRDNERQVARLVFPRDMQSDPASVCILDHFGAELFGRRIGDVFTLKARSKETVYTVDEILYQPEAAGDFHL